MAGESGEGNICALKVGERWTGEHERQDLLGKIGRGNVPFGSISPGNVMEGCGAGKTVQPVFPAGACQFPQPRSIQIPLALPKIQNNIKGPS